MIAPTYDNVYRALVNSFNGQPVQGLKLTAVSNIQDKSAIPDSQIPFLGFSVGSFTTSDWNRWTEVISLEVQALLKVRHNIPGAPAFTITRALDDLQFICGLFRGLPIDEEGRPVAYTPKTSRLFEQGKLQILCDRVGPTIKVGRITEGPGTPYAEAQLTFGIEFFRDLTAYKYPKASVVAIGMTILDPALRNVPTGWDPPGDITYPQSRDVQAAGRFNDDPAAVSDAPFSSPTPSTVPPVIAVDGPLPASVISRIVVTPYAATVAALATLQANAIGIYQDSASFTATALASWASSDPTKATVSATGLITGVATGTTNITATYEGVTSNALTVTVP